MPASHHNPKPGARDPADARERELRRFALFLGQAAEFRLAIALYNRPLTRAALIRQLSEEVLSKGIEVSVLDLHEPGDPTLLRRLKSHLAEHPPTTGHRPAVMVINAEEHLDYSGSLSESGEPALKLLEDANLHRDLFPQILRGPLVLWVSEAAEQALANTAPDLWDWRSHIFDLRDEAVADEGLLAWANSTAGVDAPQLASKDGANPRERIRHLEEQLEAYRQMGNRFEEGRTLTAQSFALNQAGYLAASLESAEGALEIARELGDQRGECIALGHIGQTRANLGQFDESIGILDQALSLAHASKDLILVASAISSLGRVYAMKGDLLAATEFFERALELARLTRQRRMEAGALCNLGGVWSQRCEPLKAVGFLNQALLLFRDMGDAHSQGIAHGNLGVAYVSLGEIKKAVEHFEQSIVISREVGNRIGEGDGLYNLARAYAGIADLKKAVDLGEQSLAIAESIMAPGKDKIQSVLTAWRAAFAAQKKEDESPLGNSSSSP